ncbi:MAG: hypothetical protein HY735_09995 [Verrucomicrobia bacterium]|nr:hypothetical protein [Verrucomicrobiota bacterium]
MGFDDFNILGSILRTKARTWVRPREFFISWNGVPTLAYRGFSPVLLEIKKEIEQEIPGIKPENPGARWPKTTLGALRDGRVLSLQEAGILRRICTELRPAVEAETCLEIPQLSVVLFQCRSLERRLLTQSISLHLDSSSPLDHEPPADHIRQVDGTMDQFSHARLEEYLPRLQADGNRESHYRKTHIEPTLVFDIGHQQPKCIASFVETVNRELPGAYIWFQEKSRHMTIRGLV